MLRTTWGVVLMLLTIQAWAGESTRLERYALVIGSNQGGENRIPLRYANSDAKSVLTVFEELGGLSSRNRLLLLDPETQDIAPAFENLKETAQQNKASNRRQEFIFYYSGHSDEKGLLLPDGRYSYKDLRQQISSLDVNVKVALLDSCEAESFMKAKGGKRLLPLEISEANDVEGYVFLASSSENEAAQESRKIGGSFFTYHFVSALRGAGDISGDNKVTLTEAYQHAYHETLSGTQHTRSGAQHAAYDMQLAGAGDIVLTDINSSVSTLSLAENISGRVTVRNSRNKVVLELTKLNGKGLDIGLSPDWYGVYLKQDSVRFTSVNLEDRVESRLSMSDFELLDIEETIARGQNDVMPRYEFTPELKGNLAFSIGYINRVVEFDRRYVDWSLPETKRKFQYRGVNFASSYLNGRRTEASFDVSILNDDIWWIGAAIGLSYKPILISLPGKQRFAWSVGLGASLDVLQGLHNRYSAPADQYKVVLRSSHYSPLVETSFRYGVRRYIGELVIRYKPRVFEDHEKEGDEAAEYMFRLGYQY